MTTYLHNSYLSAIVCNFMLVGHQKRTIVSENLQKLRTTWGPLVLKFWENIRTTSTKNFTVVLIRQYCVYQDMLSAYCARREDATLRQKRPLRLKLSGACTACWARLVRFSILLLLQAAGAGVDLLWAAAQNRHALLFPLGQNFHPKVTSGPRKNIFICLL